MKQNLFAYPAIFEKEETGYSVTFPDVPGCLTQGDDLNEAVRMAQEILAAFLLDDWKAGNPLPVPTPFDRINCSSDQMVVMITTDMLREQDKIQNVDNDVSENALPSHVISFSLPDDLFQAASDCGICLRDIMMDALQLQLQK